TSQMAPFHVTRSVFSLCRQICVRQSIASEVPPFTRILASESHGGALGPPALPPVPPVVVLVDEVSPLPPQPPPRRLAAARIELVRRAKYRGKRMDGAYSLRPPENRVGRSFDALRNKNRGSLDA